MVIADSFSGSWPASSYTPWASVSRNGMCGAIVNMAGFAFANSRHVFDFVIALAAKNLFSQ